MANGNGHRKKHVPALERWIASVETLRLKLEAEIHEARPPCEPWVPTSDDMRPGSWWWDIERTFVYVWRFTAVPGPAQDARIYEARSFGFRERTAANRAFRKFRAWQDVNAF